MKNISIKKNYEEMFETIDSISKPSRDVFELKNMKKEFRLIQSNRKIYHESSSTDGVL
jgi:hypothetical protein